jgi:hypothetical protein
MSQLNGFERKYCKKMSLKTLEKMMLAVCMDQCAVVTHAISGRPPLHVSKNSAKSHIPDIITTD